MEAENKLIFVVDNKATKTQIKNAVQVIKSFANQQEQFSDFIIRTLTNFDFTINQIAYQPAEEMIYVSQLFLEDVVNKKLRSQNILNHSQFILQRAKKFSLEGWMLHPELFAALSKLPKDICSPHTCGNIIATQYSYLFGIQNFVWGLLFYTSIFLAGFFQFEHPYLLLIMLATWVSVAYAAYLLHAMVYRIHIICKLCVATHIINLLIAILYTSLALT